MTLKSLRTMPWIGEDPVLDLANTVVREAGPGREDIDFFAEPELTEQWRARAADRRMAALPLDVLARLRAPVRAALEAVAEQRVPPADVRAELNRLAAAAPVRLRITEQGGLAEEETGGPAEAVAAREALVMVAGEQRQRVRRCSAPSCGMFFQARRRDQAWCSLGCGNRARSTRRQPKPARD
ncbi:MULTISPECIES: ABATE domain-containing protein [unclassified Streptomyces]|uniref:ABATE domain-containing protein n=1 Tax=unclassified Streptomyces TaxID=2593676 RepID=UPI0008DCD476|nr:MULTISPECIES: ABATE domain-containing protein [unclassified Streptomyces]OII64908.1 hypothetical protein BJP39_09490 [Streptomyces sp. CC77]